MKKIGYILAGVLIGGVLLNGNAINAAAGLMAQPSAQKFYVDGERVQMEAYSINGSNYVKLRDVGRLVGFNVTWDAESNSAMIDTGIPYEDDPVTTVRPIMTTADTAAQMSATITLPTDGSKYIPKVGDVILCDDGTTYEIKDVSRWESNVFMDGPMPDMPVPTCDWSLFPELELPKVEARHFQDSKGKEILFVRNLYETRRMQYTLYNAIGNSPGSWRDGKPLAKVFLTIPDEYEPYTGYFWPWRASEVTKHVENIPRGRFRVEAWDFYSAGIFQYTRYLICTV